MGSNESSVFNSIQELRDNYAQLLLKSVEEGLSAVEKAKASGGYIGAYYDFPTLSYKKNGLPDLSSSISSGPTDYRNCFLSFDNKPLINRKDITSFGDLLRFVREHPNLHNRFGVEDKTSTSNVIGIEIDEIIITSGIKDSIERYIHKFNSFEFDEQKAIIAITPTLSYIFDHNLTIDIYVPILFLSFQFDEYKVADGIFVERISDEHHLARHKVESYNTSTHKAVISSATHALVLKGWHVPNHERMWHFNILSNPRAYPLDLIDKFFGALRISSSVDTGYAQVYSQAVGWAAHCIANLPYLEGATVRSYPGWFENYYWNLEVIPDISMETMEKARKAYNNIISSTENSINLSVKRLNRCVVRDAEEDSVLDVTIAMETLLSDDGNQEMTYKLAMRVGALSTLDPAFGKSPQQAFRDIKRIYSYRSAIIHGSKNLEKKRIIKIDEENEVAVYALAVDYLRMILRILLEYSIYRDPKQIDNGLLLTETKNHA